MAIEVMQTDTMDRIIKMLSHAVSDDQTRQALNHLQIKSRGKGADLVATDGRILSTCFVVDDALARVKEAYIDRDHIPFLKIVKKQGRHGIQANVEDNQISFDGKIVTRKPDEVRFPDARQFMTDYKEPVFETSFNPQLLLDLAQSMSDKKEPIVKLQFKAGDKHTLPIQVMVGENKGVLMPCRF